MEKNYEIFPIDSCHASILKEISFFFKFKKLIKKQEYNKIKNLLLDYNINRQIIGLKSFDLTSYDEGAIADLITNVCLIWPNVENNLPRANDAAGLVRKTMTNSRNR